MGSNNEYEHQSFIKNLEDYTIDELKELQKLKIKGQRYRDAMFIREEIRQREFTDLNKCINDPWYYYTTYCRIDGLKPTISKENFDYLYNIVYEQINKELIKTRDE